MLYRVRSHRYGQVSASGMIEISTLQDPESRPNVPFGKGGQVQEDVKKKPSPHHPKLTLTYNLAALFFLFLGRVKFPANYADFLTQIFADFLDSVLRESALNMRDPREKNA